jgi:hypothetical protein
MVSRAGWMKKIKSKIMITIKKACRGQMAGRWPSRVVGVHHSQPVGLGWAKEWPFGPKRLWFDRIQTALGLNFHELL